MKTYKEILEENFEIVTEDEQEDLFNECLDCEGEISVVGSSFYPSDILKNCDPTAYRCRLIDFLYYDFDEFEGDLYKKEDLEAAQELFDDQEEDEEE
jgi:hypothetical protein